MNWILYDPATPETYPLAEWSYWAFEAMAAMAGRTNVPRKEPVGPVQAGAYMLKPLTDISPDLMPWQRVASRTITDRGDSALAVYELTDKDIETYRAEREGWAAERRWNAMEAGLVWLRGGHAYGIATDAVSRANIAAERAAADAGLREPGDPWKCLDIATGQAVFLDLTDAEVVDISTRVRAHVVALFRAEREFVAAIRAAATVEGATAQGVAAVELAVG